MPEERKYSGFDRLMALDQQRAEERKKKSTDGAVSAVKAVDAPNPGGSPPGAVEAVKAVNSVEADKAPNAVSAPDAVNPPDALNAPNSVDAPNAVNSVEAVRAPNALRAVDAPNRRRRQPQPRSVPQPEAAPMRDFSKVANSIIRDAVAGGYFKGKSKQLYDYLYSQTRGHITPRYSVRLSRTQIMRGAHLGSMHTFTQNINYLQNILKLIHVESLIGERDGNNYTVYLPEEAGLTQLGQLTQSTQSTQSTHPSQLSQKLPQLVGAETASTAPSSDPFQSTGYGSPNTSSKTYTTDDDAFHQLTQQLRAAAREITGSEPGRNDSDRWGEVAQVLVEEMKEAAARTRNVSSAPAFLAAHLRRCFATRKYREDREQKPARPKKGSEVEIIAGQDLSSATEMFRELLSSGDYSIEMLTNQFGAGFSSESWASILSNLTEDGAN